MHSHAQPVTGTGATLALCAAAAAAAAAAGGDDLAAHVLPHQLQELVVLAGLDPADSAVLKLLGLLHQRIEERGRGRLFLDDLLDVAAFYRETPLAVVLQLQCHAAAAVAAGAADEVEAAAGQLESRDRDSAAEVWQEGSQSGQCEGEAAEQWGDGTGQDMLAHHIAQHRLPAPSPGQPVECM